MGATPRTFRRRLFWLLICALIGLVIGLVGSSVSGNQAWFIAIPASIAVGWLVFANPEECVRPGCHDAKPGAHDEAPR